MPLLVLKICSSPVTPAAPAVANAFFVGRAPARRFLFETLSAPLADGGNIHIRRWSVYKA